MFGRRLQHIVYDVNQFQKLLDSTGLFIQYSEKCSNLKTKNKDMIQQLFVKEPQGWVCYYILLGPAFRSFLAEGGPATDLLTRFGKYPLQTAYPLERGSYIEIGSRPNIETSDSSIVTKRLRDIGIDVVRVEKSYLYPGYTEAQAMAHHDTMTSMRYDETFDPHTAFVNERNVDPSIPITSFPKFEQHGKALLTEMKMDAADIEIWYPYFLSQQRVPTETEMFHIINGNTEHSRHGFFGAQQKINGSIMPDTMFEIIKKPYRNHQEHVIIAFHDNASAVYGGKALFLKTADPTILSPYGWVEELLHLIISAETHNYPTTIEPFQGALTGAGGMLRDLNTAGKGSHWGALFAGYIVDEIHFLSGYRIPGEYRLNDYPSMIARGKEKYLRGIAGVAHYGNCSGIPTVAGFTRTFSSRFDGRIRSNLKCVLYAGGIGTIRDINVEKQIPERGSLVIQVGGPAYNVGFGGGLGSSDIQKKENADRDQKAVQRGNPLMGNSLKRVMEALAALEEPVVLLAHDQGAVGPCNAATESIEKTGGKIDIRKITIGDPLMSVVQLWGAEYQERNTIIIKPQHVDLVQKICAREGAYCDVLGTADDSGMITVVDSNNPDHTPVKLPLDLLLTKLEQKTYEDVSILVQHEPFKPNLSTPIKELITMTWKQVDVGHKGHIVYRKDHTVGGRVVQAQTLGKLDFPISDYGLISVDLQGSFGQLIAMGEQSPMVTMDAEKGARMTVAEAVLNAAGLVYDNSNATVNWMWAAKRPGQNDKIYRACAATSEMLDVLGIPTLGGKDSLSMITDTSIGEIFSLDTLVIALSGRVRDIDMRVTALLQHPGMSSLGLIDFSGGNWRLGGSALAQAFGNIGSPEQCPDVDPVVLRQGVVLLQDLIERRLITAVHDTIGDGLFTACAEMAMAACCGVELNLGTISKSEAIARLFAKEARIVVEYLPESLSAIKMRCADAGVLFSPIGRTRTAQEITVLAGTENLIMKTNDARAMYAQTNTELVVESILFNNGHVECAAEEAAMLARAITPRPYQLSFFPTVELSDTDQKRYKVLIVRDTGSNGEKEMQHLFAKAGFDTVELHMDDLVLSDTVTDFDSFVGMVWVGGFSSGDVLGAGTMWASKVLHNEKVLSMFRKFFRRPDTFTLGVCNGCQALAKLLHIIVPKLPINAVYLDRNKSHLFEARTCTVRIAKNPSILFKGMEGSILSSIVSHGEGQFVFEGNAVRRMFENDLVPMYYVDDNHQITMQYPFNPNGSTGGIAGITTPDGRVTLLMPHPEREAEYFALQNKELYPPSLTVSPWMEIAHNAMGWVLANNTARL
jgi:phosphoribosylformylglycinamidine synthase